jgi:predicted RNA-binding protein
MTDFDDIGFMNYATMCEECVEHVATLCSECIIKSQLKIRDQTLKDFVEKCNNFCWNKDVIMKIEDIKQIAKELEKKE